MRDLASEMHARLARAAVVEAGPQPRANDLVSELGGCVVVPNGVEVSGRARGVETADVEIDFIGAQEFAKDFCHRRRVRTVGSWVLGMVGRRHEGSPTGLFSGRRVAVIESRHRPEAVCRHRRRVDRSHRTPEEESVLGVQHRHQGVGPYGVDHG